MLKDTLLDTLFTTTHNLAQPLLTKVFFFHDIRITCQTNHPALLAILDKMLGFFPQPEKIEGEVTYFVLCYDSAAQFPVQVPRQRVRTETIRLLTNTKLKDYQSSDYTTQYQSYVALPPINQAALNVIHPAQGIALTQLEMPERYQPSFLGRYVFLLALGQLMHKYGFEPCHAGTVTAPWDAQQGALIIGRSGSGKTTLSIGCARIGCGLLGDDLVMLRGPAQDEAIRAYAISHEVSVRSDSIDLWPALSFLHGLPADIRGKRHCTIEEVGIARLQTSIRFILFPSLTREAQSSIIPLSKANTLKELIDHCLGKKDSSARADERLFALLSRLAEQAPGYRLAIARGVDDGPRLVRSLFTGNVP